MRRHLRTRAGFVALGVLSLALCIGANLIVFTLVKALWLRPSPIVDPDRVVMVTGKYPGSGRSEGFFFAEYGLETEVRRQPVFEAVAGQVATSGEFASWRPHVAFDAAAHEVEAIGVTWQYFSVMGLSRTMKGRDFTREDDRRGAPVTGIISDRLWRTAFHASPDVIDTQVAASPVPIRIVGVAPPDFHGARLGEDVDLWLPRFAVEQVARIRLINPSRHRSLEPSLLAFARLRPGIPVADAVRAMTLPADATTPVFAQANVIVPIGKIYGTPGTTTTIVEQTTMMWIAAATAGVVVIAGCVTLMALVVVHYERRRQELAVRMALGCSPGRLMRSLVLELGGLGVAGVGGACVVAVAGLRVLPLLSLPGGIDLGRFDLTPDWRVAAAGAIVTAATLAIATYAPLRRATRHDLLTELVASSSKSTSTSLRLRRDIVALQVAVTAIALLGAGPFARTIVHSFSHNPRFDVEHTLFLTMHTRPPIESDTDRATRRLAEANGIRDLIDDLRSQPGVETVSLGGSPIGLEPALSSSFTRIFLSGLQVWQLPALYADVGSGWFKAMNLTCIEGRVLTEADASITGDERPVVVTKSFAEALWRGGPAVDRVFGNASSARAYRIVGVVNDVAVGSLRIDQRRGVFGALDARSAVTTGSRQTIEIVVRAGDPERLAESVRRSVARAFPNAFETDVATGEEMIARDSGREQLGAWFFTGFGLVALALGIGGVFGLVAYVTESREREMGIRLALGAMPGQLLRVIVCSGFTPVVAGTAAGIGVSAVLGRLISSSMFGVSDLRASMYALVASVMIVSAGLAALAAAWRVRRVSPSDVLRAE